MFNKTIRSVLSLALVFCLLLGMSGNAIAMAVSNPASGAIDKIDADVNATIADLEAMIAELEKEVATQEQNLADAQGKLNTGKEDLAEAQKTLDEKKELLNDARAELDELQGKLDEADEMLGKLEEKVAEYQKQLDDAQKQLDDAAVKLENAKTELDAAMEQWEDADNKLTEAKAELDEKQAAYDQAIADGVPAEALAEAKAELDEAKKQWEDADKKLNDALDQLTKAYLDLAEAEVKLDEAQAEKDAYQAKLNDAKVQLADAQDQVDWAKAEYQKLYDTIDEIETTINNYQAKADEADAAVVKAEEALPKAEVALVEAKEALADAKTLIENVKATYATLHNAVTNPEVSAEFVRETVATLNEQVDALWDAALVLQTSLHELIAAYEELEGFAIDPIVIEDYYFEGLVIEAFEVGEYHYEEVGFHFAGYKFDGYTVDAVTVEGYTFEGFTAPEMPAQLTEISAKLDDVIAKTITLRNELQYYMAAAKTVLAKAWGVAEDEVVFAYNFLKNNLNKAGAVKVYNWLYNNPDVVCGFVKEFGVYGLELLVQYGPYALDLLEEHSELAILGMKLTAGGVYLTVTLGAAVLGYVGDKLDFLNDYNDEIIEAARKLYAKYGDEAKALVKVYVEYLQLEERYYNATHADYTIFHDSLFVAIGDGASVGPNNYVDQLAELLEIPHMTENLAEIDMTVEDAISMVKDQADLLAKADLITLNFSNITASTDLLSALADEYDNDFTSDVNQTIAKGLDKVLAELKEQLLAHGVEEDTAAMVDRAGELAHKALNVLNEKMIAEGMDEATVNMVMDAAEAYLAAYVTRMAWYPALVKDIREINPDAQIVIVGTYNELEGVVVEVGNRKIDAGEIEKCLIAVANLENLLQAFACEKVIYVHASAVETVFEEAAYEDLNNLGYLMSILGDEMLPSEDGHAYIANEIFEALNVEYKIWGDVNGDRKVNCRDARLILRYAAELITEEDLDLTWGDVNGDGMVNARDARLILKLSAELIEHFPVCNLSEE